MASLDSPFAAARTIRQRIATCCGVPCAAIHCSIFCNSTAESAQDLPMHQHKTNGPRLSSYLLDTTLAIDLGIDQPIMRSHPNKAVDVVTHPNFQFSDPAPSTH